jgi:hypothetical protein
MALVMLLKLHCIIHGTEKQIPFRVVKDCILPYIHTVDGNLSTWQNTSMDSTLAFGCNFSMHLVRNKVLFLCVLFGTRGAGRLLG